MAAQLEDTLVGGYRRLAAETPRRRIDIELRILDVFFAAVFGFLLLPVGAGIALLLLVTSGRPVLYRGQRVGRGGHFFTMVKFRTLTRDAESRLGPYLGKELVALTEAEYTPVGRWLKASQLDEIPQLWNVLRGDMSFVGPRPIRARFFAELATDLPAYWQRLVVRPGLTGLRPGAPRLRDLDGREALARPRMDRRPLGPALPADARRDRLACPAADVPALDTRLRAARLLRMRSRARRKRRLVLGAQAFVISRSNLFAAARRAAVEPLAFRSQLDAADAAVVGVDLTPDEPERLEPVDVVRDRRALEVDVARQHRLADDPMSLTALSTTQVPSDPPAAASASSNASRTAFAVKTRCLPSGSTPNPRTRPLNHFFDRK